MQPKYILSALFLLFSSLIVFAQPDADKPSILKDQVIMDDLIVDGSACVGTDCVDGESFGFDTGRYKENNLRIHFDDTSASASFPGNDWRIVINDTGNGGANYFGIEDATAGIMSFRIEAGAPANSLVVDNGGRVGIGTMVPATELHILDGDSPILRLEQDGSSGFTPQIWDLASNETNFFIRDVTNGSTLPFRIQPGAPSNALYIRNSGNIGLGTAAPTTKLHIENASTDTADVFVTDMGRVGIGISDPTVKLHVMGSGIFTGELEAASDERLKKNIAPLLNASSVLNLLDVVSYEMKSQEYASLNLPKDVQYGLLAQDVEKHLPALVSDNMDNPNGSDQLKTINYIQLIPFLIKANQEQEEVINTQKKLIEDLTRRIELLEQRN